jgi:hypothetical protein
MNIKHNRKQNLVPIIKAHLQESILDIKCEAGNSAKLKLKINWDVTENL